MRCFFFPLFSFGECGLLISGRVQLLSHDSENSAYAKARRILPSEFREFTQWMYDYVEKPSPQVDLIFFRGRDLPKNAQEH